MKQLHEPDSLSKGWGGGEGLYIVGKVTIGSWSEDRMILSSVTHRMSFSND